VFANAEEIDVKKSLTDFDDYMAKILADWNEPGAGVAVIHKDKLAYVKGFGYRDYGDKLPVTKDTLFQIASNTKLFTSVAAGLVMVKFFRTHF
jgi:CubicO group peptidase (beta-lactamase class C family)